MRPGPVSCALVAALSLSSLAARASGAIDPQAVQATGAYARQHLMVDSLVRVGIEADRQLGLQASCKSEYRAAPMSMQVVAPAEFVEGKADPVKGGWLVRFRLDRCGESKVYNALFVARDGGPPAVQPSFPGTTLANAILVHDALPGARTSAMAAIASTGRPADCKEFYVYDMQVVEAPHDVTERGKTFRNVWNERWTFSYCGTLVDVPMRFTPSPDGGADFQSSTGTMRTAAPAP